MTSHRICTRCIVDTSVPGVTFRADGTCSYCEGHEILEREFPLGDAGERRVAAEIERMKRTGRGKSCDCVLGVSGGRDSTWMLRELVRFGVRPLAVHFNDGFGNPVAGENIQKAVHKLGVRLVTVTSDWRESKDIKIAFLRASVPDMEEGTDLGIATSLYGIAARERVRTVVIGQSFRTEGISPLEWNYLDGKYLREVHRMFGTIPLRKWTPEDPGFNLDLSHMFHYTIIRRIRVVPLLYSMNYVRSEAQAILEKEFDWVYPGAHYYDDLYQALMTHVMRVKFGIDRRKVNYSALVRTGQMSREEALERIKEVYVIEDPKVIGLCIKRLGLSQEDFGEIMKLPPRNFRHYPTHYNWIRFLRLPVLYASRLGILPGSSYVKYFKCG